MIEVYELLCTKEEDLARVRREIETLQIVTPLLLELDDIADFQPGPDPQTSLTQQSHCLSSGLSAGLDE
jgi:hypothetical protein